MRYGYACINLTLAAQKIIVNRSMMKRTFTEKGIAYASSLALANFIDLEKVIDWNIKNKMLFYRMSSDMVPWMSEYEIADLPDYEAIQQILARCGKKAIKSGMRLSYHPGPFNVLASNNPQVILKTIKELRQHAEIMDMMHLPATPFSKINIHVGGAYGDKMTALKRFAENYVRLPATTMKRLTIENDDKINMFSIKDLLWLNEQVNIPVAFDYFHHTFCTGGLNEKEALFAAIKTWPADIVPVVHYSSSRKKHEDPLTTPTAHADYVYEKVNTYKKEVDIMFEAKAKELAVMKYKSKYRIANLQISP
jgi:UV DNA damage endonuclease